MTIKIRNRINIVFTITALVISSLQLLLLIYQLIFSKFEIPDVYLNNNSDFFLFSYNPVCVIAGIIFLGIYVVVTSKLINSNFENTQTTEIVFFLIFLLACLCDSLRLLVALLKVANTYSRLLMQVAYVSLFARILAPLALLGITILSDDDTRQNVDRNCVFILITALFFAKLIPFNTAVIFPNFCISYGHTNIIRYSSFFMSMAGISALLISNKKNQYSQKTTIGFSLLSIGYSSIFYCYNIFHLVIGMLFLTGGTYIYLKTLHKQYLWLD